jgi:hypothetical protein
MTNSRKALGGAFIGSGVLLALGSLLPWATVSMGLFSASKNGTSGDGIITLILAVPLVLFGVFLVQRVMSRGWTIAAGVISVVALALVIFEMFDLPTPSHAGSGSFQINVNVEIGIGLWLCLIAALAATVTSGIMLFGRASSPDDEVAPTSSQE